MNSPARSIQAGRMPGCAGSTKRSGRIKCGAIRRITFALDQRLAHELEPAVLR